jgi:hypothetical protein
VSAFGPEQIPAEFPFAGTLKIDDDHQLPVYECSICWAIVRGGRAQEHADWHNGERMRNFHGF